MNKDTRGFQLYLLAGLLVVTLLAYAGVLYHTQVTNGSYYLEQSVRTITQKETVEASRGIITDRNGTALVSNRLTYSLTFDSSRLDSEDAQNAAILRLLQLCRSRSVAWTDNLPLSSTAPFLYTLDSASDTQKSRFLKFLQDRKLLSSNVSVDSLSEALLERAGISSASLFDSLREAFSIPSDWSDTDARAVMGVRYELAIRELVNTTAYILVEDIDSEMISLINDGNYLGARIVSSSVREYETDAAAHVLGYVSRLDAEDYASLKSEGYSMDDWIGKTGVESAFEQYLRGTDGTRVVSTNADGKITSELYSVEPQPGSTVELTLDLKLQEAVESTLASTVQSMNAKDGITSRGAGAAVIQVGTGDVLALASYPTYQLSTYSQDYTALSSDPANPLFNRATSGTYAPGSTFKPCTAVAALEEGKVTTTERINDTGRWYYPGAATGDYANCWLHSGHGLLNITQAITNSCNYFFAEMGYRLGLDTLNKYAQAFGLGEHTGIEIGDAAGSLAEEQQGQDLAPWAAFGQANYLFTPLQLSNYIATMVSGGKRYPAHLLREVKSYDNSRVVYAESDEPEQDLEISDSTLSAVKAGMLGLTTTGSLSSYFKSCVVTAGAKTGTAQVSSQKVNNGVFVCFAPYDNPEIALAIVIEKGGSGAALASTAVSILNSYFTADEVGTVIVGENQLLP